MQHSMLIVLWLFVGCALWLMAVCCVRAANQSKNDFYAVANAKLARDATNCTRYIPSDWRQLMREHEPETSTTDEQPVVPEEYLYACLHDDKKNMNETAPFSFAQYSFIRYNMAINDVLSLGFDGTLITKACIFDPLYFVHLV